MTNKDDIPDLHVLISSLDGVILKAVKELIERYQAEQQLNQVLAIGLTVALMRFKRNKMTAEVVVRQPETWPSIPYQLNERIMSENGQHNIVFFLSDRINSDIYAPHQQGENIVVKIDPRLTDEQVLKTAQMGAYGISIHQASGKPMDEVPFEAPTNMINPSSGVMLMARAHWEKLDDERKSFHLLQAQFYLLAAIREDQWPKEKDSGKKA